MAAVRATETHRWIAAVWRMQAARLIALLTRIVHDVCVAADLPQDALVAPLEQWSEPGKSAEALRKKARECVQIPDALDAANDL